MAITDINNIELDLSVFRIVNVRCKTNDTDTRKVYITITNDGQPHKIETNVTVAYKVLKPDGTFVYNPVDEILTDGRIFIDLTDQCVAFAGIAKSELQLVKDGKIISTMPFNIIVDKSEVDSAIESTNELNMIYDYIEKVDDLENQLDEHIKDNDVHITDEERTNWNGAWDKRHEHNNKAILDNITAYYTIDEKEKISTIERNANNYIHPTTAGNKHIPSGGSRGQILRWSSSGTAEWGDDNDTSYTHPTYTSKSNGLYKITVDNIGHVSETIAVSKADIVALGIPSSDTVTTVSTTGSGNAITSISSNNGVITATKGSTFLTSHPSISKNTDTTSTSSPSHGGTFTTVDSVTRDSNGHVTKINTKTITLPSASTYTLPTASSSTLGGVKTTSTVTSTVGLTPCPIISGVPYYKDTDTDSTNFLPLTGGTVTGDIYVGLNTTASHRWIITDNTKGRAAFGILSDGKKGVYNSDLQKWIIRSGGVDTATDSNVYVGSDGNIGSLCLQGYEIYVYDHIIGNYGNGASISLYSVPTLTNKSGYSVSLYGTRFAPAGTYGDSGVITLGDGNAKWKQLYATTTTISTSDRNVKDNIAPISDLYKQLFMKLLPVSFTYIDNDSGRTHIGFISQDVEDSMTELGMTGLDFAGFCKDIKKKYITEKKPSFDIDGKPILDENGNQKEVDEEIEIPDLDENGNEQYIYSLRYSEFIGIIVGVLQDNVNNLNELSLNFNSYKNEINDRFLRLEQQLTTT